jgi:hypothetical protein
MLSRWSGTDDAANGFTQFDRVNLLPSTDLPLH